MIVVDAWRAEQEHRLMTLWTPKPSLMPPRPMMHDNPTAAASRRHRTSAQTCVSGLLSELGCTVLSGEQACRIPQTRRQPKRAQ